MDNWLEYKQISGQYIFEVIHITEKNNYDDSVTNYLKSEILKAYRDINFYKYHLENANEAEIKEYIKNNIVPGEDDNITKNVRQGDWGEVIASLIVIFFQKLTVPIKKLRWKFNKNRSVFGTDMIAHNSDNIIKDIYYYEIKTRLNPQNKEGTEPDRHYITVIAHNTLLKDEKAPNEIVADFLERYYFEIKDYDSANIYKDIIKNPDKYNKNFELFFVIEKSNFIENILNDLNALPPTLKPLRITIVYIDNLKRLIDDTWKDIEIPLIKILQDN